MSAEDIPSVIPIVTPRHVAPENRSQREGLMGTLLKVKRRTSQALLSRVGVGGDSSDLHDPEYDALWNDLLQTECDFEKLGESFGRFADNLATWTDASRILSAGAANFFSESSKRHSLTDDNSMAEFASNVTSFAKAGAKVDDSIRRHITKEFIDRVIGPVKSMVVEQIPLLKKQHSERSGFATDVSSYRRRLEKQRRKLSRVGSGAGAEKIQELIHTLEAKLKAAEMNFHNLDRTLRQEIEWVLAHKHDLVHKQTIFCMCCYRDFYKRASDEFDRVVNQLDNESRKSALDRLAKAHASGPLARVDNRSGAEKAYDRGVSKLGHSAASANKMLQKRSEKQKIAKQNKEVRSRIADVSANMSIGGSGAPPPPPRGAKGIVGKSMTHPNTPPGSDLDDDSPPEVMNPVGSSGQGLDSRIAEYTYEAEEEGELSFRKGDVLVVIAEDESGWGMGHLKGRPDQQGIFPLNYLEGAGSTV